MTPVYPSHVNELTNSLLWPLNLFYAYYQREMPQITPLFDRHLPQPYRQLLGHTNNMTPTLESYFDSTIHIERLNVVPDREEASREVILRLDSNKRPVEYGASRIFLSALPSKAVDMVMGGHIPLGTLLKECRCDHTVELSGFFKVKPTAFFSKVFKDLNGASLYGRRNSLVSVNGDTLAEVCEILPLIETQEC